MGSCSLVAVVVFAHMANLTDESTAARPPLEQRVLMRMLEENNELRASVGLPAHELSTELTQAAQDHAEFMARTGSFSHYSNGSPGGRAVRYGYQGSPCENIANGYPNVTSVFRGWRSSGGHWANIISRTRVAGFGYAASANGSTYWVAMYGD